jgi:hypothetical protein
MNMTLKKSHLTPARQRLLELMQSIDHGKIKGLSIIDGQPVLAPPPRIVQKIKFTAADTFQTAVSEDFTLKKETTEFFKRLDRLGTGVVKCIEVKNGVPFSMDIEGKGLR